MSMSPEMIAIANRAIRSTFETTSVAWQEIPHWETGDPAQQFVRTDVVLNRPPTFPLPIPPVPTPPQGPFGGFVGAGNLSVAAERLTLPFRLTYAQASASSPDQLLSNVMTQAAALAQQFDAAVVEALERPAFVPNPTSWYRRLPAGAPGPATLSNIVGALIEGRQLLEDSGFRSASCLLASTQQFINFNQWTTTTVATSGLLTAANTNSLHRVTALDAANDPIRRPGVERTLMLGRRQDIPPRRAGDASPGEEPVDIAVTIPPSLEVIGDDSANIVHAAVRIGFATRIKDARGIVVFHS